MSEDNTDPRLGGWSISQEVVNAIAEIINQGDTIVELGSGTGTGVLAERYRMISIENNPEFLNIENAEYIHAPIIEYEESPFVDETGWYDHRVLGKELPTDYDLLLIDGPHGRIGRSGILLHLDLFRSDRSIIVDDSHRETEEKIAREISKIWDMKIEEFSCGEESNDGELRKFHILSPRN